MLVGIPKPLRFTISLLTKVRIDLDECRDSKGDPAADGSAAEQQDKIPGKEQVLDAGIDYVGSGSRVHPHQPLVAHLLQPFLKIGPEELGQDRRGRIQAKRNVRIQPNARRIGCFFSGVSQPICDLLAATACSKAVGRSGFGYFVFSRSI